MEMSAILSQTGGSQDETIQGTLGLVTQLPFQTAPSSSTALDVQPEGDGSVEAERRKLLGLLKVAPTSPKTRSSNVEKDIALGKHENPKNTVPINNPNEHSTNEKPNRQEEVCAIQDAKGGAPSSKVPTISQKLQAQDNLPLSRRFSMIPEDQLNILNRTDSWLPPDLGRKFPPANVPIAILNLWNDAVDGVSETSQESHQQSADTAEDAVNHDAGDVGVDPGNNESSVEYSESESESDTGSESNDSQYSWPPSDREYELRQCRGIELPPDSSPPVLMAEDKSPSKSNIPITMENLDQPGPLMRASPPVQNSEPIRFGVVNVTDSQSSQLKAGDLELNYNDQFAQQFDVSTRDSNIPGDVQVEETPHKTPIKQLHSSRSEMHHSSTIAVPSTIEMSAEKQQTAQEGSLLSTERERRGRSPSKPLPRPTSPCSSEHSIEDADKHRNEKKRKLKNDEKENRLEAITRKVKRLNTNYGFSQDTPLSQDPILKASRMRERFRTKKGPSKVLSEASENTSRAAAPTLQEPHKGGIARTTYERFTEYYPQYTGDQDLFHGSCIRLSKVLATDLNFPESSWDDFIFYYSEGYQPYLERCMKRGEDPIPYVRFFAKMRKEPHCDQNIVTDISISDLLSARDVARNAPLQSETNQQSIVIVNSVGDKSSATTLQRCETEPKVSSRGFNNHKTKPRFFVEPGDEDTEADKVGEQDRRVGLYNRTAASSSKIEKTLHKDNKATTIPASRKEWFEEPNTPFKEFLTSYLKLKSVNGALGQVNEKGKTIRDTEPANILDWPV